MFLYEDALRRGRTVVVVFAEEAQADEVHAVMKEAGAESVDAARERWWIGLRDAEEQYYTAPWKELRKCTSHSAPALSRHFCPRCFPARIRARAGLPSRAQTQET